MEERLAQDLGSNQQPEEDGVSQSILAHRFFSPGVFGIILLMFLFTFAELKCSGSHCSDIKGYSLATGFRPGGKLLENGKRKYFGPPNYFATIALLSALAGLTFAFFKSPVNIKSQMIAGLLGFFMMLCLFFDMKRRLQNIMADNRLAEGMSIDFKLPFWLVIFLFLVLGILGIRGYIRYRDTYLDD